MLRVLPERALTAEERADLARVPGVVACAVQADGSLHLTLAEHAPGAALAVQGRLTGLGIMVRRCELGDSLEEVFLSLTAAQQAAPVPADGSPR
jgi:hypothetical protein